MKPVAFLIGLACVVGSAGCGDDVPPAPTIRTDVLHCDIGDAACQGRIYDSVATMLGLEGIREAFDPDDFSRSTRARGSQRPQPRGPHR